MARRVLFILLMVFAVVLQAQDSSTAIPSKKRGVSLELALTGCFGGASNNTGDADLKNLSYESLTFNQRSTDSVTYKLGAGINTGFELNLLFGKKRNLGFGAGIHFTTGINSFTTDDFSVAYRAQDGNGRSFKRVLSSRNWDEQVTYTSLSVPVLFKYRALFGEKEKMGLFAEIGPVVVLLSSAKTTPQAKVDFGAVYATEGGLHYEAENAATDWILTRDAVEQHFSDGGAYSDMAAYFNQQYSNGYYVGIDNAASGAKQTIQYKTGFGGLIRLGFIYQISKRLAFSVGGQCMIVSSARKSNLNYQPVEVQDDFKTGMELNSLLNSTGPLLTAQYGLHIGIILRVIK